MELKCTDDFETYTTANGPVRVICTDTYKGLLRECPQAFNGHIASVAVVDLKGRIRCLVPEEIHLQDPNKDSQMPEEWRKMLDVHPRRHTYPFAAMDPDGEVDLYTSEPILNRDTFSPAWGAYAFVGRVADMTGIDWRKTLYRIPAGD